MHTTYKRKTVIIIANMCKLVSDPKAAAVFFPRLLPLVEKVSQEIADPEARSKAEHAYATLKSRVEVIEVRQPSEH